MKTAQDYEDFVHDVRDPSPWQALFLDQSLPLNAEVKTALINSVSSRSRQFLLPFVRPLARAWIAVIQILKTLIPNRISSSRILHLLIFWGLKYWVQPGANWLILRHMHIGSEILEFIRLNLPGIEIPMHPLRPLRLEAIKDDLFLNHDVNLFNFVIRLNEALNRKGVELQPPKRLDFSCISEDGFPIEPMPERWTNFVDLETAIEIYTPMYQFWQTDSDFWRASHSLQLDESIAIYLARILEDPLPLQLVSNRHPLVPLSTLKSGYRLMLHGLSSETLHAYLIQKKQEQLGTRAPGPVYDHPSRTPKPPDAA
jgi:hypothetical protein